MNAVEIERAVSALAAAAFDPEEFPYAFLEAFGNKATTIKRLRAGASNKSDIGGVLQNGNIHIAVAEHGRNADRAARKPGDAPQTPPGQVHSGDGRSRSGSPYEAPTCRTGPQDDLAVWETHPHATGVSTQSVLPLTH